MTQMIRFFLNGHRQDVQIRPDTTVLEWLRGEARLKGTKEGCAEGDCGACSVLIGTENADNTQAETAENQTTILGAGGAIRYRAVNSCILSMGQIDGKALVTVEGLKTKQLHPVQAAMAENGSSQCGFCTPGIVMSLSGLAADCERNHTTADDQLIHDTLAGNLCRCTGYRPIVEAARKVIAQGGAVIKGPAAGALQAIAAQPLLEGHGASYRQPATLRALLELREQYPKAVLLAGGTDLGVALADYHVDWDMVISTAHVQELRMIHEDATGFHFGAAVTWSEVLQAIGNQFPSLTVLLRRFGSVQIRNQGTIGGNIGTASPIGDGPPALIGLGAIIELASLRGNRFLPLEDFFLDYRKTELQPDEVIASLFIPKLATNENYRVYKVSKRYDQDISSVCGAFRITLQDGVVNDARIAFGGMAAIPVRVYSAERDLVGKAFDEEAAQACALSIAAVLTPLSDWRGSAEYRLLVAQNLVERFRHDLAGNVVEVMAL
ncbi:xanthine dehydrogenase small subunit [Pseudochrobactrum sp. MP213Fo]|uniref:xanthine dehydrogenase small subunit n=1 Tax=Pseudochrobactrum sp. MP213Fo TaxID=3022250 RepID=UPI003BA20CF9